MLIRKRQNMNLPYNHIIQYPSGRWGFVGHVAVKLGWVNKDGSELTDEQAKRLASASNPAMLARSRSFETKEAAETALIQHMKDRS